ncbi:MAG: DUF3048 domain-containing protein, partial [Actinomycetota bacterium]|nr:DUF3048 domain-containing protein [Actinomycetota bacterium]
PCSLRSPHRPRRGRGRSRRGPAVGLLAVATVALAACSSGGGQSPAPTATVPTSSPSSTRTTPPGGPAATKLSGGPVLAAKIDNTGASRPRIGVGRADVVYVEPVEAGLTRLLALWSSSMPPQIGPVRSGRETDVDLLANYGRVAFAFSGGSAGTLATLARGTQVNLSNDASGVGFSRSGSRAAPYNVIGDTRALLARAGGSVRPTDPGFRYGAAPAGGTRGVVVRTAWAASRIELRYDTTRHRYLVVTDGRPDIDADGSQHSAATVVVQRVSTTLSANTDVNGVHSPLATVVGRGAVDVLRDGRVWHGTWSRSSAPAPTSFVSGSATLTMATGSVWVLLVPVGQAVVIG